MNKIHYNHFRFLLQLRMRLEGSIFVLKVHILSFPLPVQRVTGGGAGSAHTKTLAWAGSKISRSDA